MRTVSDQDVRQALVEGICGAVRDGAEARLDGLLDLLELVADHELLDRLGAALAGPVRDAYGG